ncbi:hypothetical protein DH86_00001334 [Scytalidium sp. 3C]|nr:hypothetical protein DH86_00001334 [Scytalidium sp. 3C]
MSHVWFVHGLTGHRVDTWKHSGGNFWPQSLFARDFDQARVMSYGYDPDLIKFARDWKDQKLDSLKSYSNALVRAIQDSRKDSDVTRPPRPIYFVPHSFGGLVVEQALLICLDNQPLRAIADATAGILFMGTPHAGLSTWGRDLRKLIKLEKKLPQNEGLDDLKSDNQIIQDMDVKFQNETNNGDLKHIKQVYFCETRRLPKLSNLIVTEESAVLDLGNRRRVNAHHLDMVRFKRGEDNAYAAFKSQMSKWAAPAQKRSDKEKGKPKMKSNISVTGPTFSGSIRGTVNANQNTTSGTQHVQNGSHSRQKHSHYYREGQVESDIEDISSDDDIGNSTDEDNGSNSSAMQESDFD